MNYLEFDDRHLEGVMRLAPGEARPTLATDRNRTRRALTAPGVRTNVAVVTDRVAGFAQALTGGETTVYLAQIVVSVILRGQAIGHWLVYEVFQSCGAGWIDLLSEDAAGGFYQRLPHRALPGCRHCPPEGVGAAHHPHA